MEELCVRLPTGLLESPLQGEEICVFQDARIEVRDVWPDELNPSTLYLLAGSLARQREIRRTLLDSHGIDTLCLEECLELEDENGKRFLMTPPFVELVEELVLYAKRTGSLHYPGRKVRLQIPILHDGGHRAWMAMQDEPNKKMRVIYIARSASWEYPTYAYPNGWDEVRVYERIEDVLLKKLYRRDPPYSYLRPFRILGPSGTGPGERDAKS
ncbi:MAG: hypothetical protein A3B23_01405 [Candidatus Colwellbacteria bacterium RIFCSPLOWO2_01_FULL_48_10]|uniref:ParB-like catalytic effector domain-containing protein n=1 Tax=Candidatus Colwellbacteria bacterium RIFCSPLOWO2_01_FULL_48_10 TaxID=1797690 RepID=A0A1G1Z747_9BACT|nr:MAG: hypothetical protein A3B23_01405 [Candidatus Colwellbacteria bacterium RIFCSPLOWO2_01_FULL_48_10]